jgi:hypothetical protein
MKVLTAIQVEHRDSAIFKSVTETLYEVANVVTSIESAKSIRYNSTSPTPQHCITYVQVRQLQRENMGEYDLLKRRSEKLRVSDPLAYTEDQRVRN